MMNEILVNEFNALLNRFRDAVVNHDALFEEFTDLSLDADNWDRCYEDLTIAESDRALAAYHLSRFISEYADQIRFE